MTTTMPLGEDPTTDNLNVPIDTLPDNASDYGDFSGDAEEIEILNLLLAQADQKSIEEQEPPLLVNDIEDYEQPKGIFLPKRDPDQNPSRFETEPDSQVLRDHLEVEIGMLSPETVVVMLTH